MRTLFLDLETTGVQDLFNKPYRDQFRLGQWAWELDGPINITGDPFKIQEVVDQADLIIGHNVFYDLNVMWGKDSTRALEYALDRRILDTFVQYPIKFRVPKFYKDANGKKATTYQDGKQKPELVKKFLSLGNLTNYHGLPGKVGDLTALAKKYNPEGTLKDDLNYGLIPIDDPEFLEYAENDIVALRALAKFIRDDEDGFSDYDWREMIIAAINNQIGLNGFRVDPELAQKKIEEMAVKKQETMDWLVEHFDFPTAGKAPWRSNPGKQAILDAMASFGLTPENTDWKRSEKTGAPSLAGDVLREIAEGTEAEEFANALAVLLGQRTLPDLALRSMHNDGYVHPQITSLQRSGRFSMSEPSLPIWGSRTEALAEDKAYFVATPGRKLCECDFSNADQRIVAALSGDKEYAKRFVPGADGHEISGRLMFGDEVYDSNPKEYRQIAKALSHAFAYGAGVKTLARTSKLPDTDDPEKKPLFLAQKFVDAMNEAYPQNQRWREGAGHRGKKGLIENTWGRRMPVDPDRAFTQAPGLIGQAGTREILCDGLIRIAKDNIRVMTWIVATVHDAVVWDIPEEELEWALPYIQSQLETTYDPQNKISQPIHFPVSWGPPSDNWRDAGH